MGFGCANYCANLITYRYGDYGSCQSPTHRVSPLLALPV